MKAILITCLLAPTAAFSAPVRKLASIKEENRVEHARELLGRRYPKSAVPAAEKRANLEKDVLAIVTRQLPKKHRQKALDVAHAVISEANRHGLDPFFVMAIIAGESSFNPDARGPVGEIGLMQLRPSTGKWMAKRVKAPWKGERTLRDPVANIKLGTAYVAWLREKFGREGQLYLAAYNMGPKNVKSALSRKVRPKDYPRHVMKRYFGFYNGLKTVALK